MDTIATIGVMVGVVTALGGILARDWDAILLGIALIAPSVYVLHFSGEKD